MDTFWTTDTGKGEQNFKSHRAGIEQSRVWIIQEVAAASRGAINVYCNNRPVRWSVFRRYIDAVHGEKPLLQPLNTVIRLRNERKSKRASLLELLLNTLPSQTSEEKDKVYGILGLAIDADYYVMEPDYRLSIHELCRAMTHHNIRQTGQIDIVFLGQRVWANELPSWCPRFVRLCGHPVPSVVRNLVAYLSGNNEKTRLGRSGGRWNASGSSLVDFQRINEPFHALVVEGFQIGLIDAIGPVPGEDRSNAEWTQAAANRELNGPRSSSLSSRLFEMLSL